jgi:hypothetical protein
MFSCGSNSSSSGKAGSWQGSIMGIALESPKWGDDGRVGPHAPKLRFVCRQHQAAVIGHCSFLVATFIPASNSRRNSRRAVISDPTKLPLMFPMLGLCEHYLSQTARLLAGG